MSRTLIHFDVRTGAMKCSDCGATLAAPSTLEQQAEFMTRHADCARLSVEVDLQVKK